MINIKKLFPIIIICLFTLQCEQGWLEKILDPTIKGCNISTACNYNPDVNKFDDSCEYSSCMDCLGYPHGIAALDSCSTCDASPLNDCTQDCSGTWGGSAVADSCGNCSASNIACEIDCMGLWGGSAVVDTCGICDGNNLPCVECDAGLTLGCDGICSATPIVNDVCEICGGDGSICTDCAGTLGGTATTDNCGTCDDDPSNDCVQDCAGAWGGSGILDNCGICGGDGSSCETIDCTDNTSDYCQDLSILQMLIDNSNPDSLNMNMDDNGDGIIEPLELGYQSWNNGRLITFHCDLNYSGLTTCGLTGEIPPEIGNLTNLQILRLAGNQLIGEIPSSIGNLTNLITLHLGSNQLTGEIPSSIGNLTNLLQLYLYDNQLTGEIPAEIGQLTNLTFLFLHSNQLTGQIPSEIGNLVNLTEVRLFNNELTGSIPSEIGTLSNLTYLSLAINQLTGSIPSEIGNLINLTLLELQANQLTGEIPENIGNLNKLWALALHGNELSGVIPNNIGNLNNITNLFLGNNQLNGEIPQTIINMTKLGSLDLSHNQFSGDIFDILESFTNLIYIELDGNQFTGVIPNSISNNINLEKLHCGLNQFSGEISDEICNLANLTSVRLYTNKFCPPYPSCLTEEDIGTQDISACPVQDCTGEWGGSAVEDCAGVCGGTEPDTDGDGLCDIWETVTDIDGNIYQNVKIGTQIWMADNLKTTKKRNGDLIPNLINDSDWSWNSSAGAGWCSYNNDASYIDTYGRLYNGSGTSCPTGWHIPSLDELNVLINYLGGESLAGGKMKEVGTEHWNSPNTGATNESGFTALPAGVRSDIFLQIGNHTSFWTSSTDIYYYPIIFSLNHNNGSLDVGAGSYFSGTSCRCLKD